MVVLVVEYIPQGLHQYYLLHKGAVQMLKLLMLLFLPHPLQLFDLTKQEVELDYRRLWFLGLHIR